jgi:hypothetical protein
MEAPMSDLAFAVHLGGGLYIGSDGSLHQTKPPDVVPVYEAPFKLPIDFKQWRDTFGDIKKALKDADTNPDLLQPEILKIFGDDYGLDPKFLAILSVAGKVAGVIAPVFAVASFAIDLAKLFGMFKDGPSALELLVKQRFDDLENQVAAIGQLIQTHDLRDGRIDVESFVARVRDHVAQLASTNPDPVQLENDRNSLVQSHDTFVTGVSALLDAATWRAVFRRTDHNQVWGVIPHALHTYPGGAAAEPVLAPMPPHNELASDHRLMVPLALYAGQSYLAGIRGISPEFRTTGDFRSNVRTLATKAEKLAKEMLTYALARTVYAKEHFAWPVLLTPHEVVNTGPLGLGGPAISPRCNRWPVGAMDLRYHDNAFFGPFLNELVRSEVFGWPHPSKRAGMDFRWMPPATLELAEFGNYRITNPEECAAAANAQSQKDYIELLAISGYTELLQLSALLHNEATEPAVSQTVRARSPSLYRDPQQSQAVTVESDNIFMTGVISAQASREPQRCRSTVVLSTQPIKRARPLAYEIKLRTLGSIVSGKRWREPVYTEFRWAQYEQDPTDSAFKQLVLHASDVDLDEHLLLAGSSPREARHAEGEVELTAHTFDWWIPVKPPFSLAVPFEKTLAEMRAQGWVERPEFSSDFTAAGPGGTMRTLQHHGGRSAARQRYLDYIPALLWQNGAQDWEGEHRMVEEKRVRIGYSVDWDADRLNVTLTNDPTDRNYVVFVVVEEKMPGSGQILHTAAALPVNGQLTYVPQTFFDEERRAYEQAEQTLTYFNEKYSESVEVGPLDPVVGWLRPGDLAQSQGVERLVTLAREHQPALLEQAITHIRGGG